MTSHYLWRSQQRNKEQEKEVLEWIYAVLGEPVPAGDYENILKDGIVLCKLANKLTPGCIKKIQERGTNFQLMENVQRWKISTLSTHFTSDKCFFLDSKPPSRSTECQKKKFSKPPICLNVATSHRFSSAVLCLSARKIYRFVFFRSPCACTPSADSPRSTQNTLAQLSAPKWQTRTNAHSLRNNCALTKVNLTCKWASTRELHSPATVDLVTQDICRLAYVRLDIDTCMTLRGRLSIFWHKLNQFPFLGASRHM